MTSSSTRRAAGSTRAPVAVSATCLVVRCNRRAPNAASRPAIARDTAAWEPEIRLLDRIGHTFGSFSPRSLAELEEQAGALAQFSDRLSTYADRWQQTLESLKRENFDRFLYQIVAPDAFHLTSTSSPYSAESFADTLLWVERGCR